MKPSRRPSSQPSSRPTQRPTAQPSTSVRAVVLIKAAQKLVNLQRSDFSTCPSLGPAFINAVCKVLQPLSDCSGISITSVANVYFSTSIVSSSAGGSSSAKAVAIAEAEAEARRGLGAAGSLVEVNYNVQFEDQYQPGTNGRYSRPGQAKRDALVASVARGAFKAAFLSAMLGLNSSAHALGLVTGTEFVSLNISSVSISQFMRTLAPTHQPTLKPTIGLGLGLAAGQLAFIWLAILYFMAAVCGGALVAWLRRRCLSRNKVGDEKLSPKSTSGPASPEMQQVLSVDLSDSDSDEADGPTRRLALLKSWKVAPEPEALADTDSSDDSDDDFARSLAREAKRLAVTRPVEFAFSTQAPASPLRGINVVPSRRLAMTGVVPDESSAALVDGPSTPMRSVKIAPASSALLPAPVEKTPPPRQLHSPPTGQTPAQKSAKVAPLGLVTAAQTVLASVRVAHAAVPLRKGQWVARAEGDGLGSSTDDPGPADSEDSGDESSVRPPSAVEHGPALARLMSPQTRAALGSEAFSLAVLDTDSDDELSSNDSF